MHYEPRYISNSKPNVLCTCPPSDYLFIDSFFFFKRYKISVYRRYSDFDVFHEVLLQRFSYRVVPAMPPKRMLKGGKLFFFQRLSF